MSLINLKDVVGLSAPLVKLIETISAGGGRVSDGISRLANAYFLAAREAKNEAQRIQLIEDAKTQTIIDRTKALAALSSSNGPLLQTLDIVGEGFTAHLAEISADARALHKRGAAYAAYNNAWQQLNRESVLNNAAATLDNESEIDPKPVNPAITARILGIVQDISDEAAQVLWGNILAGEIKHPGSFSLRTLEVLKNLEHSDAQIFKLASNFAIRNNGVCMIILKPIGLSNKIIGEHYDFTYEHILKLFDCGLLIPGDHGEAFGPYHTKLNGRVDNFRIADQVVFLEGKDTFSTTEVLVFSPAGNQLYKLVAKDAHFSLAYLTAILAPLQKKRVRVKYGRLINELSDGTFTYEKPLLEMTK